MDEREKREISEKWNRYLERLINEKTDSIVFSDRLIEYDDSYIGEKEVFSEDLDNEVYVYDDDYSMTANIISRMTIDIRDIVGSLGASSVNETPDDFIIKLKKRVSGLIKSINFDNLAYFVNEVSTKSIYEVNLVSGNVEATNWDTTYLAHLMIYSVIAKEFITEQYVFIDYENGDRFKMIVNRRGVFSFEEMVELEREKAKNENMEVVFVNNSLGEVVDVIVGYWEVLM